MDSSKQGLRHNYLMAFVKVFDNLIESISLFDTILLFEKIRSSVNPILRIFTLLLLQLPGTQNQSVIKIKTLQMSKMNYHYRPRTNRFIVMPSIIYTFNKMQFFVFK